MVRMETALRRLPATAVPMAMAMGTMASLDGALLLLLHRLHRQRIAQRQFRQPASGQIAKFHWMIRVGQAGFPLFPRPLE